MGKTVLFVEAGDGESFDDMNSYFTALRFCPQIHCFPADIVPVTLLLFHKKNC